jgi:hypothetical protein
LFGSAERNGQAISLFFPVHCSNPLGTAAIAAFPNAEFRKKLNENRFLQRNYRKIATYNLIDKWIVQHRFIAVCYLFAPPWGQDLLACQWDDPRL